MKSLEIEDIKEILRIEIRKQILHAHHVDLGTNKWDDDHPGQNPWAGGGRGISASFSGQCRKVLLCTFNLVRIFSIPSI